MLSNEQIEQHIDRVIKATDFKNLGIRKQGKVRDVYMQDDKIILVATDRHSSFDRIIAHVPFKGQILTEISNWWFKQMESIIPNHIIDVPDPNVVVAKKYDVVPLEIVPRGYITGSTSTSLWTAYEKGQRDFGNFTLPDGLKKNQKLDQPVITVTTKSDEHDRPLTPQEAINEGLVTQELWEKLEKTALEIFTRGQELAAERGLILVDTKYEFGLDENNNLVLIDEIHTPDSSRWWFLDSYQQRFDEDKDPEFFDKEFLRLWFKENCDPYNDETLPEAPHDMIVELASRYMQIYEKFLGKSFAPDLSVDPLQRIESNLKNYRI